MRFPEPWLCRKIPLGEKSFSSSSFTQFQRRSFVLFRSNRIGSRRLPTWEFQLDDNVLKSCRAAESDRRTLHSRPCGVSESAAFSRLLERKRPSHPIDKMDGSAPRQARRPIVKAAVFRGRDFAQEIRRSTRDLIFKTFPDNQIWFRKSTKAAPNSLPSYLDQTTRPCGILPCSPLRNETIGLREIAASRSPISVTSIAR